MNNNFDININNFNGPLDLLINLIRDKKTDIFDINLVELTNDYLRIINQTKETNLEIASEYLVMAATLIQIKAKLLLEEPQKEAIAQQDKNKFLQLIAEYQQFKKISEHLREQEQKRHAIYIKKTSSYTPYITEVDLSILDTKSSSEKLLQIMRQMFERINAEKFRIINIDSVNVTTEDQIKHIRRLFTQHGRITFQMIFNLPSISHFVITLIALLDMSRKEEIILEQNEQFGEILISKGVNFDN